MQRLGNINVTNPGMDQHNVDSDNATDRHGNDVMNWMGQSSSSLNPQNQISYVRLLSEGDDAPSGTDQGLQGTHSENGQVRNRPSSAQGTISGALPNNIDLNTTYEGNSNNTSQEIGAGTGLNPSKPDGAKTDPNPPGSDPSNPILISSGISGYVVEENDGRQGMSSGGRRLSCKRRAPESSSEPLLLRSNSSSSAQQTRNSDQRAVVALENSGSSLNVLGPLNNHPNMGHFGQLNAGIGFGMTAASAGHQTSSMAGVVLGDGMGAATFNHQSSVVATNGFDGAPVMHQISSVAGNGLGAGLGATSGTNQASILEGQADNFERNIRLRRNANQQSFGPDHLSIWNSFAEFRNQTDMFYDPFDDPLLARNVSAIDLPAIHSILQVPNSLQTRQHFQGVPMSRATGSSSSSIHAVNRGYNQHQQENLRNINIPSGFGSGNLPHMAANMNFGDGNLNFSGNARNGPNSNIRLPSAPTWFNNPNMADLYSNRYADTGSGSESRGQGGYFSVHAGNGGAAREMDNSIRGGNVRLPQRPLRARLMPRAERPGLAYHDIPAAHLPLTPAQRRSLLVSGVHNALALVRRRGALRFEDVMVIDNSVLLREPEDEYDDYDDDEDDVHEDMRLDVDNMSYEELLALEEQIGIVNTGLSEEAILAHLRRRKHHSITVGSPVNNEPCCICQEEYADGEDLGKLDCGHDFHANCIKQWLMQKNVCPICKLTALAGRKREH